MTDDLKISDGFNPILDWLAKQQTSTAALEAENQRLQQENDELRMQNAALQAGRGVHVVINGAPFYLTSEPPQRSVAMHVVPDLSTTTITGLEHSFLLGDTDEQPIFTNEKTA